MFEWIASPEAWVALISLTALEIALGIDNIIFISILVGGLPAQRRDRARLQGLALAMLTRILLLLSLAWMMRLTEPLFSLLPDLSAPPANHHLRDALALSGRDLILLSGGLFLLWKSAHEIYQSIYFAMAFSLGVEMLNIRARRLRAAGAALAFPDPVHLRTGPHAARPDEAGP